MDDNSEGQTDSHRVFPSEKAADGEMEKTGSPLAAGEGGQAFMSIGLTSYFYFSVSVLSLSPLVIGGLWKSAQGGCDQGGGMLHNCGTLSK